MRGARRWTSRRCRQGSCCLIEGAEGGEWSLIDSGDWERVLILVYAQDKA